MTNTELNIIPYLLKKNRCKNSFFDEKEAIRHNAHLAILTTKDLLRIYFANAYDATIFVSIYFNTMIKLIDSMEKQIELSKSARNKYFILISFNLNKIRFPKNI